MAPLARSRARSITCWARRLISMRQRWMGDGCRPFKPDGTHHHRPFWAPSSAASWCPCTCRSSSLARSSDARGALAGGRTGRRFRAAHWQLPERRHLSPAQDDGAAMGRRVRGDDRSSTVHARKIQSAGTAIALPEMRSPDSLVRERPRAELPVSARQVFGLRDADRSTLSVGRGWSRACCSLGASGTGAGL